MTTTIPNPEGAIFCRALCSTLERLMQCLDGLNAEQLNWRPPAPDTNSLYVLAVHTLGNVEENVLFILADQPGQRDREQEFLARGASTQEVLAHWQDLRERLQAVMPKFSAEDMAREITHPRRGVITGRELLLNVAKHAAEHLGHAELTRDLIRALT